MLGLSKWRRLEYKKLTSLCRQYAPPRFCFCPTNESSTYLTSNHPAPCSLAQTWYFECGRWLDTGANRSVLLNVSRDDPAKKQTQYRVTLHTSNKRNAGTSANVWVALQVR